MGGGASRRYIPKGAGVEPHITIVEPLDPVEQPAPSAAVRSPRGRQGSLRLPLPSSFRGGRPLPADLAAADPPLPGAPQPDLRLPSLRLPSRSAADRKARPSGIGAEFRSEASASTFAASRSHSMLSDASSASSSSSGSNSDGRRTPPNVLLQPLPAAKPPPVENARRRRAAHSVAARYSSSLDGARGGGRALQAFARDFIHQQVLMESTLAELERQGATTAPALPAMQPQSSARPMSLKQLQAASQEESSDEEEEPPAAKAATKERAGSKTQPRAGSKDKDRAVSKEKERAISKEKDKKQLKHSASASSISSMGSITSVSSAATLSAADRIQQQLAAYNSRPRPAPGVLALIYPDMDAEFRNH